MLTQYGYLGLPSPKTQHLISRRNSQVMHSGDHTVHTKCSQEWTQLILLSVALHLTPTSPDFPNHNNNLAFIQRLWVRLRICTPYLCSTWCCSSICCHFSQEWKPEGRSRETSHPFKLIIMSLRPRPSHPAYWHIVFVFVFLWLCLCLCLSLSLFPTKNKPSGLLAYWRWWWLTLSKHTQLRNRS